MAEYLKRDDVLTNSEILTVDTRDYGRIDVVPVEYLADIPSADVQPVKRGRWEKDEKRNSFEKFCSICKHEAYWDTDYGQQLFDYCPYCGARMIKDGDTE